MSPRPRPKVRKVNIPESVADIKLETTITVKIEAVWSKVQMSCLYVWDKLLHRGLELPENSRARIALRFSVKDIIEIMGRDNILRIDSEEVR